MGFFTHPAVLITSAAATLYWLLKPKKVAAPTFCPSSPYAPPRQLGTGTRKTQPSGTIADYVDHLEKSVHFTELVHSDLSQSFGQCGSELTQAVVSASQALSSPFDTLTLQRDLNLLGASPSLREDGVNGHDTMTALAAFQKRMQLQPSGKLDGESASAIRRGIAAVLSQSNGDVSGAGQAVSGFFHDFSCALGVSDSPMGTLEVQKALNALGAEPHLAEDGIYGPKTTEAVKSFQMHQGIPQNGIVGIETASALRYFVAAVNPKLQQYVDVSSIPSTVAGYWP